MFSTLIVIANIGVLLNANELELNVGQLIGQNVIVWCVNLNVNTIKFLQDF